VDKVEVEMADKSGELVFKSYANGSSNILFCLMMLLLVLLLSCASGHDDNELVRALKQVLDDDSFKVKHQRR